MKSRIVVIFVGILVLWSALAMRAAYLQFLPNDRLNNLQNRQFQTKVSLPARRGAIVDSNGRDLAMSAAAYSLYADPKIMENRKQVARKLAKVLNQSSESIYSKIKDGSRRFVWIQRMLEQDKADEIKSWDIRGLSFVEEWRRVYPNETLLAQTLGFLGSEGQGLEGLELGYNQALTGNKKKVMVKRDARGRPLINDGLMFIENPEGSELKLTVDSDLQYRLESELANAVSTFEADHAVGVILDAKTSAVLALASAPTFDVNKATKSPAEYRRNKIVTDAFEPGSTMKAFVIAAALRDGLIQPNTKFYCEKGSFRVGDRIIREAETKEKFEDLTVSEILAVSSNVGTTKIAFKMGQERLRQGLLDFGFGQRLGVDLPGEARGMVQALPWRPHLLSNISFGHGISTTPLQIANAFAAIANGGVLNTPYIVQSMRDAETGELVETQPKPIRRILSAEQASQMRAMLLGVTTKGGTGGNARVDGFMVAGKTGTAQKVNPNGRGYLKGVYVSSFGGFIPANDPKFVIYIAVDSPRKSYYGSTVAAPVFARVASYAVRKEGIAPLPLAEESTVNPKTRKIAAENPKPVKKVAVPELLTAAELDKATEMETVETVPNLLNMTTREVLRRISGQELKVKFVGQGLVSDIQPSAGSQVPENKEITVILK
ncbi:penicillin-binding transpeptidase domain-containing protein [Bdellovibrio bacteriovorus]|uniref:penicillin-binding transpeptidase domain-containing protein n=1 Tax=Bdellovibrio bacteriovorus TaxID=959 RepID=UPI0021D1BF3B|nr:penicillin-binding transpeptidase domain-containing protein [Bdellovibrio bacteriovorus]UXR64419.1 penicillin-binding transpeptidase domain-containing protein [Bdellovibrio bacteriovorus]